MPRAVAAVAVAVGLVVGGACSDDDGGSPTVDLGERSSTTEVADGAAGEVPHAMAAVEGWETVEHRDPAPGEGAVLPAPYDALDWYAAYERSRTSGGATTVERVAVQGVARGPADLAEQLVGQRYEPDADLAGRPVLVGEPVAPTEPVVLLVDAGAGTTVVVTSHELDRDELLAWARALRFVSEAEWAAVPSMG